MIEPTSPNTFETATAPVNERPTVTTSFPKATIIGYPRIGPDRELKKATEKYWKGELSGDELHFAVTALRDSTYDRLTDLGLEPKDYAIPESFSLYDQVLDTAVTLGAVPERYQDLKGLDRYFALARGTDKLPALEMTKWFDTNYHYLVPELSPSTVFGFEDQGKIEEFRRARDTGYVVRPTLIGPVTFLALSKAAEGAPANWTPLELIDSIVTAYREALTAFAGAGVEWIQFDEPALTTDNLGVARDELIEVAKRVWSDLSTHNDRPQLLVTLPYGNGSRAAATLAETDVEAIHIDLKRTPEPDAVLSKALARKTLVAGVVEGRNIWRADLRKAVTTLQNLQLLGVTDLSAATATSLQHVPITADIEQWDDPALNEALHRWLSFADQKVQEVAVLGLGLADGWDSIREEIEASDQAIRSRASFEGVIRADVRARTASVTAADTQREDSATRQKAQAEVLQLPPLPTTTIGSFPQTQKIRRARAAHARGQLTESQYHDAMKAEIESVIRLQEELDLDVLVHGEAERNDMVQYFAEQLDGYAVTRNGWVQSYGTRCTRPSILWGDVSRPEPMTVDWTAYAASLTDKPVKGMLTGPTTMIAWSFPREDLPFGEVAAQIGLALQDEVKDLETAGIRVIQVDEPALRELLPLDESRHQDYLDQSVRAFRLATSDVDVATQIHTHLCYSEFGQVLDAILGLNADVTSIEAARSRMELLEDVDTADLIRGLGPGVWDIHSPRVPGAEELAELLLTAAKSVPTDLLWVNPDCGLKTRGYTETEQSLRNLVQAAKAVRAQLQEAGD
ncbi:5-methyltetrahydropteroyltriglutamate--homocysteine S-methyltransferase [Actinomycetaceae bacterium MB13-C1-2]|nr:5-methyltetrahydropteroyltriglutamate--homocysteine S-methyltransferase [Actinomycetaceae bacterium MB13-C1-2]